LLVFHFVHFRGITTTKHHCIHNILLTVLDITGIRCTDYHCLYNLIFMLLVIKGILSMNHDCLYEILFLSVEGGAKRLCLPAGNEDLGKI
jgi:hypothetical protein